MPSSPIRSWPAIAAAALLCGACTHGAPAADHPTAVQDRLTRATTAAELRPMLQAPLGYGGLWFSDPACTEFAGAGTIEAARLDAFAGCLASLHLQPSDRKDPLPDVVVLQYAPGFEVEAQLDDSGKLRWIGYANRHDVHDALPSVTPEALEGLRIAGQRLPALDAAARGRLAAEQAQTHRDFSVAWMKVCIDADGNVTGAHAREVTSPIAADVFGAAVQAWKFRPFTVAGHAIPVCSTVLLTESSTMLHDEYVQWLPYPIPAELADLVVWSGVLNRTAGATDITPDEQDRRELAHRGEHQVVVSYDYCIDATGAVSGVHALRSSGLARYDAQIGDAITKWRFDPFVIDGKALPVCAGARFVYQQH
jgi:hypothetical protein